MSTTWDLRDLGSIELMIPGSEGETMTSFPGGELGGSFTSIVPTSVPSGSIGWMMTAPPVEDVEGLGEGLTMICLVTEGDGEGEGVLVGVEEKGFPGLGAEEGEAEEEGRRRGRDVGVGVGTSQTSPTPFPFASL